MINKSEVPTIYVIPDETVDLGQLLKLPCGNKKIPNKNSAII